MFAGLQKTTLVNFPRRVAAAVFLPGCNMRCPYCYNTELALASPLSGPAAGTSKNEYFSLEKIYGHLEKRAGVITGVTISGGEPLISPYLSGLIKKIKSLNLAVKLDTNGLFPDKLKEILDNPELRPDMVALDIKTAPERYNELFGKQPDTAEVFSAKLLKTIETLTEFKRKNQEFEMEFRTVLVPPLVGKKEILRIASILPEDAVWRFADFTPQGCLNPEWNSIKPYTKPELDELIRTAAGIIPDSMLR